jgi:tetratricopeptide (TPR) repeat protein
MIRTRVTALITVIWFVACAPIMGGDAGLDTPFNSIGAGARSIGMGGGTTSLTFDATAIHYNPAGLADLDYQEVAFMHSVLFEGSNYDFAAWAYPITENHGFAGGLMRISTGDIIRRDDFAYRGIFDYACTQLMLAYGRNFGDRTAAGVGLKIVHQSLDNYSDFGIGIDAGFTIKLYRSLHVGAVGRELLQPELKLITVSEKTPRSGSAGLSLRDLALSDPVRLALNLDLEKTDGRDIRVHAGAEISFVDQFALRVGYDRDEIAFGAGLKRGRLKLDYAYKLVDQVRDLNHISVSFLLGKSTAERIRLRELALLPPEPTEAEKRYAALMERADYFFHRFQLDSARVYLLDGLDMKPNDQEIIGTLAAIEESRRVQRAQEEALATARDDVAQTLNSFVAQAERLLAFRLYAAALDLLNLIFDIDPGHAVANALRQRIEETREADMYASFELARTAADAGQWVEAMEAYNRVLVIDPSNQAAFTAKQQLLTRMDLPERIRLAIQLYEQGDLSKARARFEAILEVNPSEQLAMEYLRRINAPETVAPVVTPVSTLEDLQADRVHWELYLEGLRHMRNKEFQQAIDVWKRVLETFPNNPSTLENIRQARLRLNAEDTGN